MIADEQVAQIRHLFHAEHWKIGTIAAELHLHPDTVRAALGGTVYRIHGTNAPQTIGTHISSGCIRLTNQDVSDLYSRVNVGTKVVVLPMDRRAENAPGKRS